MFVAPALRLVRKKTSRPGTGSPVISVFCSVSDRRPSVETGTWACSAVTCTVSSTFPISSRTLASAVTPTFNCRWDCSKVL